MLGRVARFVLLGFCTVLPPAFGNVEILRLTSATWSLAPEGKEADAILGDILLQNGQVAFVIAWPGRHRHANMTVTDVGGCVIDATGRNRANDQLSAYYPGARLFRFARPRVSIDDGDWAEVTQDLQTGRRVRLQFMGKSDQTPLQLEVTYVLHTDDRALTVCQKVTNPTSELIEWTWMDALRADVSFKFRMSDPPRLFTASDYWWAQAYGVENLTAHIEPDPASLESGRPLLRYQQNNLDPRQKILPGESRELNVRLLLGRNRLDLLAESARHAGKTLATQVLEIRDAQGPVSRARVTILQGEHRLGSGRTNDLGEFRFQAEPGAYRARIRALGRTETSVTLVVTQATTLPTRVTLDQPGYVVVEVTDDTGARIPAKAAFYGLDGTADPFFGPQTYVWEVHNLIYAEDGQFRTPLAPGRYRLLVSHGPEYDMAHQIFSVRRGEEQKLQAQLKRSVATPGWISAEFHSHSSPSGDNTSSQLGRVLNLLAEHLEFAPCTEHNRISTYEPHLRRLRAEGKMATCSGIELTGQPLPINHQNAFPLEMKPNVQDGGAPRPDPNPVVQIQRLALWDDAREKVVQTNHPNLAQIYGDKDYDGKPDEGHRKMLDFMDLIEVHPPHKILLPNQETTAENPFGNCMFRWLQLLNLGYRIPGVVNTDAHYNFHGSGWLRNYVAVPDDDPARVRTEDMVQACKQGHLVMTNGPFLEVRLRAIEEPTAEAIPGDDLVCPQGAAQARIRVQCANWLDIDRVQILVNGRAIDEHNYRRRRFPHMFSAGPVIFDQSVTLKLHQDSHVIVVAIGEEQRLGEVMGPEHAEDQPVAVSNPIFVDLDGDGFTPNGDLLGATLP